MTESVLEPVPAPAVLGHRQILIAFSGLVLAMLLAALDSTIVSTGLPTIVSELGGLEHLAWVVTGYLLAQTLVTPIYGQLGDLYGRKIVLQSAIVLFLVGSALCGLSQNMTQLILFRAVQGLGGGGLVVTTQAVVGDIVPPRERGRYQGIFGAVFGLSSIAGPLLGGYFTTHLSWRWIFYINLPVGIAALLVLAATLPSLSRRTARSIDYAGAGLLAVMLSSITLVADLGGTAYPWSSSPDRPDGDGNSVAGDVSPGREKSRRDGAVAETVPPADVRDHFGCRVDRGLRPVRISDLLPVVSAGGKGRESDGLRDGDDPDDGRNAGDVDRVRAAH